LVVAAASTRNYTGQPAEMTKAFADLEVVMNEEDDQLGFREQGLGLGSQRYTPPPGWGLEKIGKWLVWTIWWCICKLL